jgi:hypothetical protein
LAALREACVDVFSTRSRDAAAAAGKPLRAWPPKVLAYPGWEADYANYARGVNLDRSLKDAVSMLNEWITEIGGS